MAASDNYFVEWKEQFVSKERGNRVVHYFLKDNAGESVLAVVGTERSVRHMFYVVSEEFLKAYGAENSVHAGFRWRSRREVVNWLTSMLSKQHRLHDCPKSPVEDLGPRIDAEPMVMPDHKGRITRNLIGRQSDIMWSGEAWTCGKQLKHYPAFLRNGISIAIQSFVYVMAEKDNQYIAYLEDMYEDKKGQKKVKVRWFHHNREVKGVISLRNPHPKEVFITSYAQVISPECVDGPAIVLTRVHYDKCSTILPDDLLTRLHFCLRQFKSNRLKPFKLSKLRGYYDQPIFSCFSPDFFEDEEFNSAYEGRVGNKRTRNSSEHRMKQNEPQYKKLKYNILGRRVNFKKHVEDQTMGGPQFKVNDRVEFLCQDSGIRGCWFRCTILEVARRQIKIRYDDLKDEDGCGNLEEWISSYRLARPDKLGIRCSRRSTVRPAAPCHQVDLVNKVGTPVDVWWSDGWWEGVVIGTSTSESENYQVYSPGENLLLQVAKNNIRVSRDWVGDRWVEVEQNSNILSVISTVVSVDDAQHILSSTTTAKSDSSPLAYNGVPASSTKLSNVEKERDNLAGTKECDGINKDKVSIDDEQQEVSKEEERDNLAGTKECDSINKDKVSLDDEQQEVSKEEVNKHTDNNIEECNKKNDLGNKLAGENNIVNESHDDADENHDDDGACEKASTVDKSKEHETAEGSSKGDIVDMV